MATVVRITLDGALYEADVVDLVRLTIGEGRAIKQHLGMSMKDWREALLTMDGEDADVLAGLVFLLRSRAGDAFDWSEVDDLPVLALYEGLTVETEPDPATNGEAPAEVPVGELVVVDG